MPELSVVSSTESQSVSGEHPLLNPRLFHATSNSEPSTTCQTKTPLFAMVSSESTVQPAPAARPYVRRQRPTWIPNGEPQCPLPLPTLSGDTLVEHVWDDEEIVVLGMTISPGDFYPRKVDILDFRLRQWFHVVAFHTTEIEDDSLEDPYWLDILRQTGHRGRDDFNEVEVDRDTGALSFSRVASERAYSIKLRPPPPPLEDCPADLIPTISYRDLCGRRYLDFSTETCTVTLPGVDQPVRAVFKQIMFAGDVNRIYREIAILRRLRASRPECFLPILAFVVEDNGLMHGFLLPFGGTPLQKVTTVRWWFFLDLLRGLSAVHALPSHLIPPVFDGKVDEGRFEHGDICPRNILADMEEGRVRLIDVVGELRVDYPGDREALAEVMDELRTKAETSEDGEKMDAISSMLRAGNELTDIIYSMSEPTA